MWQLAHVDDAAIRRFSGGHFFINGARGQLLKTLAADLALIRTESPAAAPVASIAAR